MISSRVKRLQRKLKEKGRDIHSRPPSTLDLGVYCITRGNITKNYNALQLVEAAQKKLREGSIKKAKELIQDGIIIATEQDLTEDKAYFEEELAQLEKNDIQRIRKLAPTGDNPLLNDKKNRAAYLMAITQVVRWGRYQKRFHAHPSQTLLQSQFSYSPLAIHVRIAVKHIHAFLKIVDPSAADALKDETFEKHLEDISIPYKDVLEALAAEPLDSVKSMSMGYGPVELKKIPPSDASTSPKNAINHIQRLLDEKDDSTETSFGLEKSELPPALTALVRGPRPKLPTVADIMGPLHSTKQKVSSKEFRKQVKSILNYYLKTIDNKVAAFPTEYKEQSQYCKKAITYGILTTPLTQPYEFATFIPIEFRHSPFFYTYQMLEGAREAYKATSYHEHSSEYRFACIDMMVKLLEQLEQHQANNKQEDWYKSELATEKSPFIVEYPFEEEIIIYSTYLFFTLENSSFLEVNTTAKNVYDKLSKLAKKYLEIQEEEKGEHFTNDTLALFYLAEALYRYHIRNVSGEGDPIESFSHYINYASVSNEADDRWLAFFESEGEDLSEISMELANFSPLSQGGDKNRDDKITELKAELKAYHSSLQKELQAALRPLEEEKNTENFVVVIPPLLEISKRNIVGYLALYAVCKAYFAYRFNDTAFFEDIKTNFPFFEYELKEEADLPETKSEIKESKDEKKPLSPPLKPKAFPKQAPRHTVSPTERLREREILREALNQKTPVLSESEKEDCAPTSSSSSSSSSKKKNKKNKKKIVKNVPVTTTTESATPTAAAATTTKPPREYMVRQVDNPQTSANFSSAIKHSKKEAKKTPPPPLFHPISATEFKGAPTSLSPQRFWSGFLSLKSIDTLVDFLSSSPPAMIHGRVSSAIEITGSSVLAALLRECWGVSLPPNDVDLYIKNSLFGIDTRSQAKEHHFVVDPLMLAEEHAFTAGPKVKNVFYSFGRTLQSAWDTDIECELTICPNDSKEPESNINSVGLTTIRAYLALHPSKDKSRHCIYFKGLTRKHIHDLAHRIIDVPCPFATNLKERYLLSRVFKLYHFLGLGCGFTLSPSTQTILGEGEWLHIYLNNMHVEDHDRFLKEVSRIIAWEANFVKKVGPSKAYEDKIKQSLEKLTPILQIFFTILLPVSTNNSKHARELTELTLNLIKNGTVPKFNLKKTSDWFNHFLEQLRTDNRALQKDIIHLKNIRWSPEKQDYSEMTKVQEFPNGDVTSSAVMTLPPHVSAGSRLDAISSSSSSSSSSCKKIENKKPVVTTTTSITAPPVVTAGSMAFKFATVVPDFSSSSSSSTGTITKYRRRK